jgi:uncharacterized protein YndB with AHSA1/START domain
MPETQSITDRIEKRVVLKAPQARVWRAIADSAEFGSWFQMRFDGPFVEGETAHGRVLVPGYEHIEAEFEIVSMRPEHYFAYRWHPAPVDPNVDYSAEPTTLVEFRLEPTGKDTVLTVVESGFDQIPAARRVEAYRMNEGGWTAQVKNIERYVTTA